MTIVLNGTTGITTPGTDSTTLIVNANNISAVNSLGFRNRIINGDCRIDQRNAGASVTQTASVVYTIDRWGIFGTVTSKFTAEQTISGVAAPTGFSDYLGITSSAATTVSASDIYNAFQFIEGFNTADLGWGTASASTVTLSFWVRSSLTGTFGGAVSNGAYTYSYPFSYTISAANTWEQKTITIAGPTAGTWIGATNGIGLRLYFGLGVGSSNSGTAGSWSANGYASATGAVSVVGTSGATFYITGVQLEAGSVASPFERRDYGRELMMCQRYFQAYRTGSSNLASFGCGRQTNTTVSRIFVSYPPMRATPTLAFSGTVVIDIPNSNLVIYSIANEYLSPSGSGFFDLNTSPGGAGGGPTAVQLASGTGTTTLTSEL